jgi:hypothetical protein
MNLISGAHNFCERREYAFNVLLEYLIITLNQLGMATRRVEMKGSILLFGYNTNEIERDNRDGVGLTIRRLRRRQVL